MKRVIAVAAMLAAGLALQARADEVKAYQKDVEIEVKKGGQTEKLTQTRWYIENDYVRLGVVADPGGAVVEFVNKATGVNHAAGDVWSRKTPEGGVEKRVGWGWKDTLVDDDSDPSDKHMAYQPYKVETLDAAAGAKTLKVTGRTVALQVERSMTLRPGTAELLVHIRTTNITDKPRRLWFRWHPYSYVSADKYGDSGCVLVPGEGSQVRKIRVGWGWDHWFRVQEPFWIAGDFKSGDGLFMTFEKEKQQILMTWTDYGGRTPRKGALTLEPFPAPEIAPPGGAVEWTGTYFPYSSATKVEDIPMGVITDGKEQARARQFLANVKPADHMAVLNSYTFIQSAQFPWHHRRRDLLGVREWGFADCAIVGYPIQGLPMRVRMVGGVFDDAVKIKGFPTAPAVGFVITVTDAGGMEIYRSNESFPVFPGVPDQNHFDREIPVPTLGIPDGRYTLKVEALDVLTRKPFHSHQVEAVIFGKKMETEQAKLAAELAKGETDRPFVTALAALDDVKVENGKAVIPIGIEDGSNVKREAFPVRFGVPLPEGVFKAGTGARVLSPEGKPVPAQIETANVWPDKSLKWLIVNFQADCPANGYAFYKLEVGGAPVAVDKHDRLAVEMADTVEVNTGPMWLRISKKQVTIPGEVFIDRNTDGKFDDNERIMLPSQPGDCWWQGEKDQMYTMQFSGDAVDGETPGVRIERNGTESAVVRMLGWHLDKDGKRVAFSEVRIEVARGKAWLNLWHRVTFAGSPWRDRIKSYGLKLRFKPELYEKTLFALDGRAMSVDGQARLYQKALDVTEVASDGKATARGGRASGAMALTGAQGSALVYIRDLWQMYPKKLMADPRKGEVQLHYWPVEAGLFSFEPNEEFWIPSSSDSAACGTGASRVQEVVLDFTGQIDVAKAEAVYDEPVVACTPPKWVQKTNVLNNLYPHDPAKYPDVEQYCSSVIDFYVRNREFFQWYGHWNYGTLHNVFEVPLYQWLVVGRYANIANEEDINQAPWLLYFRSGDRKYLNFARVWTRHLMEVQSIRWHDVYPEFAGMSRRHHYTAWIGRGDWGHTMLCPYLEYYHATGYMPAWQMALLTAKSMQNTWEGEWRYISNPLIGNTRMYLETGEQQYKDVADRIWKNLMSPDRNNWFGASHGSRLCTWYARFNPECMTAWKTWSRTGRDTGGGKLKREFDYLDTFGPLGDMTGDEWYAHKARFELDAFRGTYTGQTMGVNPVYRGMIPTITQYIMGNVRMSPFAAGQIARSRELFPAENYNLGRIKEVVVQKDKDEDFSIYMNTQDAKSIKVNGPDGKPADFTVDVVFEAEGGGVKNAKVGNVKVTVKADGKTGLYRMPSYTLRYLGCSLPKIAILASNTLQSVAGAPLYVRADDLGVGRARVIMSSTPGNSLEVFTLDGKRIFSQTYVRPGNDAIGIENTFDLPRGAVLKLGDKVGVTFPEVGDIPLYLSPGGVFDLPASIRAAKPTDTRLPDLKQEVKLNVQ